VTYALGLKQKKYYEFMIVVCCFS